MTILQYQQQRKTTWPCYFISSSNTKPHDYVTLSTAATQNHMTMLHYQQQHKTIWPYYTIKSNNTKPHDHIALSTSATQNHMVMLHYQHNSNTKQYGHRTLSAAAIKTTCPCYTISSENTKSYDHATLPAEAATSGYKPYVSCPVFTSFVLNIFPWHTCISCAR